MITLLLAIFFCQNKKLILKWSYQQIIKKYKLRNLLYLHLRINNMRSTRDYKYNIDYLHISHTTTLTY